MIVICQLEVWLVQVFGGMSYHIILPSMSISNSNVTEVPPADRRVIVASFDRRVVNAPRSNISIKESLKSEVVGW
jgi:hypothetical protein